ncbi:MAG: response regulator [Desulfobacterales bacterium]|nr:response regulator [Desulfobacterales bacterium]
MGEKKKVLVVEDEPVFSEIVKEILTREGISVTVAADAYSGTQQIIKGAHDLIVLDLMMPAGGGFSLLKRIRNISSKKDIPVVIMTGKHIDGKMKHDADELNVAAIFSKPIDPETFVPTIQALLMD